MHRKKSNERFNIHVKVFFLCSYLYSLILEIYIIFDKTPKLLWNMYLENGFKTGMQKKRDWDAKIWVSTRAHLYLTPSYLTCKTLLEVVLIWNHFFDSRFVSVNFFKSKYWLSHYWFFFSFAIFIYMYIEYWTFSRYLIHAKLNFWVASWGFWTLWLKTLSTVC